MLEGVDVPTCLATARRDRLATLLLLIGICGLLVAAQRAIFASYDGNVMFGVAKAITHHRLSITRADDFYGAHTPYSSYGIGLSLVEAPLYQLEQVLHIADPVLVTLANPILVLLTALAIRSSGRELGWSRRLATVVAIGFVALTMALQASTDLFSEPGVALAISCVTLGALRWRRLAMDDPGGRDGLSAPLLFGAGFAISILFRSDSLLLVGISLPLLPFFVPVRALVRRPLEVTLAAVPVLAVLAWTCYYAHLRTGGWLPAQYGGQFTTPLLTGLHGLLFSWGKGFFVFNPILLLAVPGGVLLWRRDRALTVLLVVLAMARLFFYANWDGWHGGVSWGPRFLEPVTVPLTLMSGVTLATLGASRHRLRHAAAAVAVALAGLSAAVSVASVWIGFEWSWRADAAATSVPSGIDPTTYSPMRHLYFGTFGSSPIGFNLSHIANYPVFGLFHFRGGASPVGIASLVAAIVGCVGAVALSRPHSGTREVTSDVEQLHADSSALAAAGADAKVGSSYFTWGWLSRHRSGASAAGRLPRLRKPRATRPWSSSSPLPLETPPVSK